MAWKKKANPGFRDFMDALKKGNLPASVLFYGVEEYLMNWAVSMIRERYVNPATEVMDYQVLDGTEAKPEEIVAACETFPLMSERRVVWVRNFKPIKSPGAVSGYGESGVDRICSYLSSPNPSAIVIFSYEEIDGTRKMAKALKKHGKAYELGTLSEREFVGFAAKRFREAGLLVTSRQMNQIVAATGYLNKESTYRLYDFQHDIEKLIALGADGGLRDEDIPLAICGDEDTFIFDLIDGISGNNKAKALEILHHKMSDDPYGGIPIAAAIISQVELMYSIREFTESMEGPSGAAAISKYMHANEFRVKKAMQYANRYSRKKLRKMLMAIYEAYESIVTGLLEPQMALELFIAQI